jgi:hypothetical protein
VEGKRVSETDGQADPWAAVPNQSAPAAPPSAPAPGYGYPPPAAGYGYGYPQPGGPVPPPYYYQAYPARKTNGLSIAAMVCGICGFVYLVPAILGVVFGCISLRQIRRDGTDGRGMAIAGIVTGSLWLALVALIVILVIAASN